MKTLLLTSTGETMIPEILKLFSKSPAQIKLAYIITATTVELDTSYVNYTKTELQKAGLEIHEIDFEGMKSHSVYEALKNMDGIYVEGGNTFHLLNQIRKSGADRIIKKFIEQGKPYIGVSAGSYIACPTIEMATWKHQDRNKCGIEDLTAMNLVPFLLSVHYRPEQEIAVKEGIKSTKFSVKILTDDQALLIKDESIQLIGKGKEIILN